MFPLLTIVSTYETVMIDRNEFLACQVSFFRAHNMFEDARFDNSIAPYRWQCDLSADKNDFYWTISREMISFIVHLEGSRPVELRWS